MDGSETRDFSLVGIGLYTVAEASRLTGIAQGRLRSWLRGYTYRAREARTTSAPVWQRQVPEIDGALGLGFLDLMEARFVDRHAARQDCRRRWLLHWRPKGRPLPAASGSRGN